MDSAFDLERIHAQQKNLRQHARLHWVHWLILALSVAITIVAWHFSATLLQNRSESRFLREANRVVDQMRERLMHYEDALRSGAATLVASNGSLSRDQWKAYARTLELATRYPGVNGIGVIREVEPRAISAFEANQQLFWPEFRVHPVHEYPVKLPIVYIEPAQTNAAAIGLDVAFEAHRRAAALLARDTGTPQISGPITLVQDDGKTPGFLFYMPYYLDSIGFDGLVYAPLVVKNLVKGVMGDQERQVRFSIQDAQHIIYDELSDRSDLDTESALRTRVQASFYGRQWEFAITASEAFHSGSGALQPWVVLMSGLAIDIMLLILFLMMTRSNRTVLSHADVLINKLGEQTESLMRQNKELESFAHVVSHDLKTPIRAIRSLSEFIEEDVNELVSVQSTRQLIKGHTNRINEQIVRSDALIAGILNFSLVGQVHEPLKNVDVSALIRDVCQSLQISFRVISIESPMPH